MRIRSVPACAFFLIILIIMTGCVDEPVQPETNTTPVPAMGTSSPVTPAPMASTVAVPSESLPPGVIPVPSLLPASPKLLTIAVFTGQSGVFTEHVTVPSGSWELWYSADPQVTGGQDSHSSTGTNSAVFPVLSIQVTDSRSGQVIETIQPPGGLDTYLWQRAGDPRPWSQKFFQGNREYALEITAKRLKSYTIEIRVPK